MTETRTLNIAVLGSTGSIGTQTLDIISLYPERFRAAVLTAGRNWQLLAEQALRFRPDKVVIADPDGYLHLKESLSGTNIEVAAGAEEIALSATLPLVDIVVTAMVGYSGLLPTVRAISAGKRVALSNKETLVVGGELIRKLLKENSEASILPVDSEHSAIFQCLQGEEPESVRRIILTASGGPFRTTPLSSLPEVTLADTLRHPNWDMGAKVTVDSATMMNKGFEMIEARWLFDVLPCRIDVAVHPQSVIHSMVEFIDGSVKAQLGIPDMHLPIQYALGYPKRLESGRPSLDLFSYGKLTFEAPDLEKFPLLRRAYQAMETGGLAPCVLNAANEVAVDAFLKEKIRFVEIPEIVGRCMDLITPEEEVSLSSLQECHKEATLIAKTILKDLSFA